MAVPQAIPRQTKEVRESVAPLHPLGASDAAGTGEEKKVEKRKSHEGGRKAL